MPKDEKRPGWMGLMGFLFQNAFTKAGAVLATSSAISLIFFWGVELTAKHSIHPYLGILLFLVLPGIFVAGLLLIPLGVWIRKHRQLKRGEVIAPLPALDLTSKTFRRALLVVGGLTFLNVLIVGVAAYRGIDYMDSTQFCGLTCHSVMAPEYTAYLDSPHMRVGCVGCHIGPGAGWFVKSKLSGVHQIVAVNLKTYSRPIPVPVKNLRPARETCEQCHWPEKFHGDKLLVRTHFADDEANTRTRNVLVLRIGGHSRDGYEGIHGHHLDAGAPISYLNADEKRQVMPVVRVGTTTEYVSEGAAMKGEWRVMDCIDCHNRPSHKQYTPEKAMDMAMSDGRVDSRIPFIHKQAVSILKGAKGDRAQALAEIATYLDTFYRTQYPDFYRDQKARLDASIKAIQAVWSRNVFPQMNITWGTYPENIGHDDSPGCFRCHDGAHKTKTGKVIPSECDTCHSILAQDEADPKILKDLNIKS